MKELLILLINTPLWRLTCEYFETAVDNTKFLNLKKHPEIFDLVINEMSNPKIPYNYDTKDLFRRISLGLFDLIE